MVVRNKFHSKLPKPNRKQRRKHRKGKGKLLAAACAGLLSVGMAANCSSADAQIFNEATGTDAGDFAAVFGLADQAPPGTEVVIGSIVANDIDFFRIPDLPALSTVQYSATSSGANDGFFIDFYDSSNSLIGSTDSFFNDTVNGSFVAPSDGIMVANVFTGEGGTGSYSFSFSSVPEPSAAGLLALGAAGLLGRRRRKS